MISSETSIKTGPFLGALWTLGIVIIGAFAVASAYAQTDADESASAAANKKSSVRYKSGKEINFEELLIRGQLKRAEISVVTGDQSQGTDGILRLRENFLDHAAVDFGEEIAQ